MIYRERDAVRFGRFGFWSTKPKPDRIRAVQFGSGSGFGFCSVISVITELCSPLALSYGKCSGQIWLSSGRWQVSDILTTFLKKSTFPRVQLGSSTIFIFLKAASATVSLRCIRLFRDRPSSRRPLPSRSHLPLLQGFCLPEIFLTPKASNSATEAPTTNHPDLCRQLRCINIFHIHNM